MSMRGHPSAVTCRGTRTRRTALLGLLLAGCNDPNTPPENPASPIDSPDAVVNALAVAYREQDFALLRSILADDPARNAEYVFYLSEPTEFGEVQWEYGEEVRIHRRMFRPYDPVGRERPVPAELWLASVAIHLTPATVWEERDDLYSANEGADEKLDPAVWKAVQARYDTDVLFDTQSELDYLVRGAANFVVIEDLTKRRGADGKFLLYIWEDLEAQPRKPDVPDPSGSSSSWSAVKDLFR